ncbi:NADP oxidoreductase [Sedimenticola hydrogenitrophicus]|uniref:NADH-quinone oxidoreductase subunit B family protein n=1 Tax=Sedimenticola hydrogenitrophicus TaxID=2967975 RepID=UPI0023AF71FF|nr:NADP oxidoreductase [Sedimenticola hydrogenitrophicus]
MVNKVRIATASLAGCFGCHMSLLDIDERLIELVAQIEFDRTPLTDIKQIGSCDVGLIEGGVCNAENVEVLKAFRRHCNILVAVGACAINGGVPAMRNQYSLAECLEEAYLSGSGIDNPQIPSDPELPLLLNQVHPVHDVVWIDYFLPGCPPSADTLFTFLGELLSGQPIQFAYRQIRYD